MSNSLEKLFIVSHSSLDLVYVLKIYEKYRQEFDVTIVVSGTRGNVEFFKNIGIPDKVISYIPLNSRRIYASNKTAFVRELLHERKRLNLLAGEIRQSRLNKLYFGSYTYDPQAGYLAKKVSKTNSVTLVDVLGIRPIRLPLKSLLSKAGVKNLISLNLYRLVFGNLFLLSGFPTNPHIALDLNKFNIRIISREEVAGIGDVSSYCITIPEAGKTAIFLYADRLGVPMDHHISVNCLVLECLLRAGFHVYVKIHPQSQKPGFLKKYPAEYIDKVIPFEFVNLDNVSVVIGLAGASLIGTGDVPTISFVKLMYDEDSDHYRTAMTQLSQNRAIMFIESASDLGAILGRLGK